jgi:hypothetical protein
MEWTHLTQGRDKWWALCEDSKNNFQVPQNAGLCSIELQFSVVRHVFML